MIEVQYHADGYDTPRPAINVKSYAAGWAYHSPEVERGAPDDADELAELAYDQIVTEFWHDAAQKAEILGLGAIEQQGRSGGWLVLTGEGDRLGCNCQALNDPNCGWGGAYRKLATWAKSYISDAPRMVRERAQSIAIDRAGESAARRMFGRA